MYLEQKSRTGETSAELTYGKFLMHSDEIKWQPPLANHCLILPNYWSCDQTVNSYVDKVFSGDRLQEISAEAEITWKNANKLMEKLWFPVSRHSIQDLSW